MILQDNAKLTIITRADIPQGYQAVQSVHAAIQFIFEHLGRAGPWFNNSNYLALLEAKDEAHLERLIKKAKDLELSFSVFREPDIGNENYLDSS